MGKRFFTKNAGLADFSGEIAKVLLLEKVSWLFL